MTISTNISAYAGDALLNWIKGTTMPTAPSSIYASLWNGDPDASGVELTGTVGLTSQAVTWGSVASNQMSSSADINFGTATGAGAGPVLYVVLADNATYAGHHQIAKKAISSTALSNGLVVKILSGNLTLGY